MPVPAADGAPAGLQFALFELGALCMAVSSDHVVQAIALPEPLTRLPRGNNALEGVFLHRGQVVPLLDLQHWTTPGAPPAGARTRQVLILRAGDQVLAILIDALKGLLRVPREAVRRVHHDDDAQEVFHSVVMAEDRASLISLLDPARLAQLAQVWAAGAVGAAGAAPAGPVLPAALATQARAQTDTCVVLRLGSTLLALPATAVGELLGDAAVQKMPGLGRSFLGMGQWRGHDLPVLDMALLLDLAQPPGDRTPWLLVLHLEARVLAFPVSEIVAVRRFDSASLQSASLLSGAMQAFCQSSCLTQQGERVYLLDAVALLDASPLSNRRQPAAAPADSALRLGHLRQAAAGALVVFKSRQLWAASMGLMREIVKLPPHLQNLQVAPDGASALRGSMEWRGQSITLQDLRMLRDGQPSGLTQEARVMVIQSGSHSVGLLVESVVALIPGHSGTRARFSAHGTWVDMVTVGSGAEQLSYQLMDLSQVAGLAPTAAVAAASL